MSAERNLAAVRKLYDAYEAGGLDAGYTVLDEVMDPEVEFSPWMAREVEQRVFRGPEGVRSFLDELGETLGDLRYDNPEYRQVSDGVVVVFTRLTGIPRGGATRVGNDLGFVFELRDGLVTRYTAYGSHDEAVEAAHELVSAEA